MTQQNIVLLNFTRHVLYHFSVLLFNVEEHMASSFSSDHYLHRNFLNKIYLLCMYYDVGNRLENEKENDEEPNPTYEHLQIAVILLLSFLQNRRM